jgi:hypothetical protein
VPGYSFAETRHSPLTFSRRDGSRAEGSPSYPVTTSHRRHLRSRTAYRAYGAFYRYFLIPRHRDPAAIFGADASRLSLVAEGGPLALYENAAGRCGR